MSPIQGITIAAALSAAVLPVLAHGPAAGMAPPPNASATQRAEWMGRADSHMKSMREMHEKMERAKSADERQALMSEHARLMHDGMDMMGGMGHAGMGQAGMGPDAMRQGGKSGQRGMQHAPASQSNMGAQLQMLDKRMDMMQHMMQMMMDRDMPMMDRRPPAAAKP
jgi:hypothetical protein